MNRFVKRVGVLFLGLVFLGGGLFFFAPSQTAYASAFETQNRRNQNRRMTRRHRPLIRARFNRQHNRRIVRRNTRNNRNNRRGNRNM